MKLSNLFFGRASQGLMLALAATIYPAHGAPAKTIPPLPVIFEANQGQAPASVQFLARAEGYTVGVGAHGVTFVSRKGESWDLQFAGANRVATRGMEPLPSRSNYFTGKQQIRDVRHYGRLRQNGVYPGVDVEFHSTSRKLEYDFHIAPLADPSLIRLRFPGARKITLQGARLAVETAGERYVHEAPVLYQDTPNGRRSVAGHYRLNGQEVRFEIGKYDRSRELVIDPVIGFATFVGGSLGEHVNSIAVDSTGNSYITGETSSINFPTLGPRQAAFGGGLTDVFVTKLNASGNAVIYSTYLGGSGDDKGTAIAIDASGSAYITGYTESINFPTANAIRNIQAFKDAFLTKLSPAGNTLLYSTYLGGPLQDAANAIAVDSTGAAYVAGWTQGSLITISAVQPTFGGGQKDAFVTKINPAGNAAVYTTYLGGAANDEAFAIAVDANGNASVAGETSSDNFPLLSPMQATRLGVSAAFVSKLAASGAAFSYSTLITANGLTRAYAAAVDASGNTYVAGSTKASNFPTLNAAQATFGGGEDAFLTVFNPTGSAYLYSTYLGGLSTERAFGVAADGIGGAVIVGQTDSINFPLLDSLQQPLTTFFQKSTDGGATWGTSSISAEEVRAVVIDQTNANVVYAAKQNAVYRSIDGGSSWPRILVAPSAAAFNSVAIDPADNCKISVGLDGLVDSAGNVTGPTGMSTTNCGATWTQAPTVAEEYKRQVQTAGTSLYWISGSRPGATAVPVMCRGNSFQNGVCSAAAGNINTYTIDPANACTTYTGDDTGAVRVSTSCGNLSFSLYGFALPAAVTSLAVSPADSLTLFAGLTNGQVFKKIGSGAWAFQASLDGTVNALSFLPGNANLLYAGTRGGSIYKSVNGGATFTATGYNGASVSNIALTPAAPGLLFAAGFNTDDGFVTRYNSSGALIYSTLHGGRNSDSVRAVASGPANEAFIAGSTSSASYPTSAGALQTAFGGIEDAFVARLVHLNCVFGFSPAGPLTVGQTGASGQIVSVSATAGCPWTALSTASWLTVTAGGSGNGNGSITYTVATNATSATRTGAIMLGGQTFTINQPGVTLANFATPTPGTALASSTVTFTWTPSNPAGLYWLDVGTSPGGGNVCASNAITATTFTCAGIPYIPGGKIYAQLFTQIGGVWLTPIQVNFLSPPNPNATINTPSAGAQLATTSNFTWNASNSADGYWLDIGTGIGQGNICSSGVLAAATTSFSCGNIPTAASASMIYAQLWTRIAGVWGAPQRATYQAPAVPSGPVAATLTAPASGTTLAGTSATFTWNTGSGLDYYWLDVGAAPGLGSFYGGQVNGTSKTVTNLPVNGQTVYVRLWSHSTAGNWMGPIDYTFAASSEPRAVLLLPATGTLAGTTTTFSWRAGSGADGYWLDIGPTPGSGAYSNGFQTALERTVANLPCTGAQLYVRLWTRVSGAYQAPIDYIFSLPTGCANDPRATLTAPAPGTALPGSSATFSWLAGGTGTTQYWLDIGTSAGSGNIASGATTSLTRTVNNLPTNGQRVYVRLWTFLNGSWQAPLDYFFTAASDGRAVLTSPAPGTQINGAGATFNWAASGTGVDGFWLDVGTSVGSGNLSNGFQTATSRTVTNLPNNGGGTTIYVRLWTRVNGAYQSPIDYTFTN